MNVEENEERMRKKKEGDTMGEKILKALEKIKKKKVTQLFDDAFYQQVMDKGVPLQVRMADFIKDMSGYQ